jgi:hypothetical protein
LTNRNHINACERLSQSQKLDNTKSQNNGPWDAIRNGMGYSLGKLCEIVGQMLEVKGQSLIFLIVSKHCGYPVPILNRGLEGQIKNFHC